MALVSWEAPTRVALGDALRPELSLKCQFECHSNGLYFALLLPGIEPLRVDRSCCGRQWESGEGQHDVEIH